MASNCNISGEELSAYAAGEVEPWRASILREHVQSCRSCARRLQDIVAVADALKRRLDESLDGEVASRLVTAIGKGMGHASEVMTLAEAAAYLRISREEIEEMVGELPVFELSGQIRVRREKLVEWISARERNYRRDLMRSRAMESLRVAWAKGAAS